jgi:D-alanyl-D-alanine carboxypeptidase/D-alanyl-D-alanine-endopeptidase (penicillin-binding protein 4)
MSPFKLAIILCFILNTQTLPVFSQDLPDAVRRALNQNGISESAVSIYIHEINTAGPIVAFNSDRAMNPASVMKLITTFAGLELLGPAFTWKTEIYTNGIVKKGRLQGDLIIKGYGDPRLNLENFWLLTRRLYQTGLREITGDLILDNSYFDVPVENPAAFDNKPYRSYNTSPEAHLVNYRTTELRISPKPENNTTRIIINPQTEFITLNNNLKLTQGKCVEWRNKLDTIINIDTKNNHHASVTLNGSYSAACGEKSLLLSLHNSQTYTLGLFKKLWKQQGGIFNGKVRTGIVLDERLPFEIYQSPPLTEIIRDINKYSNNTAARQLYLTLGAVSDNKPATLNKSNGAVRQWLKSKELDSPEFKIENGSGLSRNERISARHLGKLLLKAFQSPVMPEFVSSLPILAVDGTMQKRLTGTDVTGRAHIKTGSLNGVKAMAGYMLDKSGRRIIIVFFVNHINSGKAQLAMDKLLQWTYQRP